MALIRLWVRRLAFAKARAVNSHQLLLALRVRNAATQELDGDRSRRRARRFV